MCIPWKIVQSFRSEETARSIDTVKIFTVYQASIQICLLQAFTRGRVTEWLERSAGLVIRVYYRWLDL